MADEIKIRGTGGTTRTESVYNKGSKKIEQQKESMFGTTEKAKISEEARILGEFVPKVLSAIDKERQVEPKPATNSDIAKSLAEEIIKAALAKKFIE
ncbi:MAG: hypothetical protein NZ927_01380 [Candidatus Calescibacterium sp.]|nr:hypothetical protein [Candidatus Calescibacterium sp.]MCX7733638.1 hypothetical protein [bacterium]MDW8087177.1 hypothetical protein [Candidatus Calescibacterium sp.]